MFYVPKLPHESFHFLLSVIILLNLVSLCRPQISNTNNQTFIPGTAINPVINIIQLLLNNKTQLQFKSYPPIKESSVESLQQNKSSPISNPNELIHIGDDYFDSQNCLLKTNFPSPDKTWFGVIDLKEECSSVEVIHSILKSSKSMNGSHLRGILFLLGGIPKPPNLQFLVNRPGNISIICS